MSGMEEDRRKIAFRKFKNVLLVFLLLLVIGTPVFFYFRITTEARTALREAKNINLGMNMNAIEFYGKGAVIYNPKNEDGLAAGLGERLKDTTENRGDIRLISYDSEKRVVRCFTYETDNIRVTYRLNKDGTNEWIVDYLWTVWDYDGKE